MSCIAKQMVVVVQINRGNLVSDTWSSVGSSAPAAGLSFGSDPSGFPGQGVFVSHGPSGTFSLAPSLLSRSNNPSWAYWFLEAFKVLSPCLCLQVCLVFVALGAGPCMAVLPLKSCAARKSINIFGKWCRCLLRVCNVLWVSLVLFHWYHIYLVSISIYLTEKRVFTRMPSTGSFW